MISVVIPVKDGGTDLVRCLRMLRDQVADDELEIVVIDSGSTDDSVATARAYGALVHAIDPADFNHGATRNLGVSLASGETVVFTSQDAVATGQHWLARLTAPLSEPGVAGSYGRQIGHLDATPPERYFLDFLYGPSSRTQRAASPNDLSMETTLFSNVCSAMPRALAERYPFADDIIMSEDQEWARRVLLDGYELRYVADAVVRHSHPYTLRQAFRRFFDSGVSAERAYLSGGPDSAGERTLSNSARRYAIGELRWLWQTKQRRWLPYVAVYEGAKFVGLKLGTHWRRLPRRVVLRMTAVPSYWA